MEKSRMPPERSGASPAEPPAFDRQRSLPTHPPPYAQHHDPASLSFPDVPSAELAPIQLAARHAAGNSLPSLSSVTGPPSQPRFAADPAYSPPDLKPGHWPSLNPLTAYYAPGHARPEEPPGMDVDAASPGTSRDGRANSVNLDDPDVRLAAEALGDLRADFVSSPQRRTTPPGSPSSAQPPEPLLSLLTTSHPLLARTIEGTTSAYNTSKNFSPRFKSGAEYVEGYLTPIGNTLGSVGRVTGVEGGVRWFLRGGRRRPAAPDVEAGPDGRPADEKAPPAPADDPFAFTKERRPSVSTMDTLPAYDEHRSPAYSESAEDRRARASAAPAAWQSRLVMSTSGLSVAMSEESLRSLKYCLRWLRWANDRIGGIIGALRAAVDRYDRAGPPGAASAPAELAARVAALRADVLQTLRDVIGTVSTYAGGALPENARDLVRRHFTSLPQRWRLASRTEAAQEAGGPAADPRDGANRVLVLAKEGLEMMEQVSGVLHGTIVSAEEWCERLGRKTRGQEEEPASPARPAADEDVVMQ